MSRILFLGLLVLF